MKTALISSLAAALLLTACVTGPAGRYIPAHWHREGVTPDDTQTKMSKCVYEVGINKVDKMEQQNLIVACMQADGFRWIPARIVYD